MVVYADTSFLFSLYAQDANTARAAELAEALNGALIVTPLQRFELRNALRLYLVEADIKTGALVETPVSWVEVYAEAEALSAAHTGKAGTRALDVLQVATAAAIGAKHFYTFDARQKTLAAKAGMKVKP
jgi:hypothetical protein